MPVIEGDYLVVGADELGGQRAQHTFTHDARPGTAGEALGIIVDRLELALAHLKHERPVGAALWLCTGCVCAITLQQRPFYQYGI